MTMRIDAPRRSPPYGTMTKGNGRSEPFVLGTNTLSRRYVVVQAFRNPEYHRSAQRVIIQRNFAGRDQDEPVTLTALGDERVIPMRRFLQATTEVVWAHADRDPTDAWRETANADLDEAIEDAKAASEPIQERAIELARVVVAWLAGKTSKRPMIDASDNAGISIDFRNTAKQSAVTIFCEPDGKLLVLSHDGTHGNRARFETPDDATFGTFVVAVLKAAEIA